MESSVCNVLPYIVCNCRSGRYSNGIVVFASTSGSKRKSGKTHQIPNHLIYRRRTNIPPDFYPPLHRSGETVTEEIPLSDGDEVNDVLDSYDGNELWEQDEIEAISSLFERRIPHKPGKSYRERPLPLPLPHKIRPLGLPTPKKIERTHLVSTSRRSISNQVYKNPAFLITLARDIRNVHNEDDVSIVLSKWAQFLRKGSLSLTICELGHMGRPDRALQVFCWVQKNSHLYPDDRVLASTVEVLARAHELKMPFDLDKFVSLASKNVYEALVKGMIKGGNLRLAWKLLSSATQGKRMLDSGVYAKLILALGKNPDKRNLVLPLLEELAKRDGFHLTQQDCTAIMKVCIRLQKFDLVVFALYDWYKSSGGNVGIVMYTTLIQSLYLENRYKEAMAIVWEMEAMDLVLDLPAYRVLIKLFVGLNDVSRTARYFSKLKDSGINLTYDIYRDVIKVCLASGRMAKCREVCREVEMAGFKLEEDVRFCNL